ncbi:reverse transcriptase domain-containing protein [Tanacetum coccineum]
MPEVVPERDDTKRWTLFTDRASSLKGSGAGLVLIGPSGVEYTYGFHLTIVSTNNEAEYEALLVGLRIARNMKIQNLEAKVNYKLVASQINGSYVANNDSMIKYLAKAKECIACFKSFSIKNIPRNLNQKADVLIRDERWCAFQEIILGPEVDVCGSVTSELYHPRDTHGGLWNAFRATIGGGKGDETKILLAHYAQRREGGNLEMRFVFGLPMTIVTDNGTQFANEPFKSWCAKLNIQQMNTAVAHPQANDLVERANKSLMEGIKTRLGRDMAGWVDKFPNVLWAHRTSLKQSNRETPFSLTYGSEAVIPAEIGMPTHRTIMIREEFNDEEICLNLDLLQERRELAAIREAKYKTKMEQNEARRVEDLGKLGPKWEGSYRITEAY